MSISDEGEKLF